MKCIKRTRNDDYYLDANRKKLIVKCLNKNIIYHEIRFLGRFLKTVNIVKKERKKELLYGDKSLEGY